VPGNPIQNIVIIGAGRLGTHLGVAFYKLGLNICQVYNRTPGQGEKLASRVRAEYISDLSDVVPDADVYLLAVSDSVLEELALKLRLKNNLVVHTSGTVDMDVLSPISGRIGVFYPVQTFSPNRRINFNKVPVCIEGNSKLVEQHLIMLARKLTQKVHCLDSEQRRILHLGAVFASNFTNFIYAVTEELLISSDIPFNLLEPLIHQTIQNIRHGDVFQSQTGPAMRGDTKVLDKHREMLSQHPDYLEIYNLITNNIIKYKSLHGKL
jgi:predicted short-subunit dehydrogenase-like oxidoreductase (DUF2520 family)